MVVNPIQLCFSLIHLFHSFNSAVRIFHIRTWNFSHILSLRSLSFGLWLKLFFSHAIYLSHLDVVEVNKFVDTQYTMTSKYLYTIKCEKSKVLSVFFSWNRAYQKNMYWFWMTFICTRLPKWMFSLNSKLIICKRFPVFFQITTFC